MIRYIAALTIAVALPLSAEAAVDLGTIDTNPGTVGTLEFVPAPDFAADEHYHPASLLSGETGPLLVAFRLTSDPALAPAMQGWANTSVTTIDAAAPWRVRSVNCTAHLDAAPTPPGPAPAIA